MKNKLFLLVLLSLGSQLMAEPDMAEVNQEVMSYDELLDQIAFDLEGIGFSSDEDKPAQFEKIREGMRLAFLELGFLDEDKKEEALSRLYQEYLIFNGVLNGVMPDDSTENLSTASKFSALQNLVLD